MACSSPRDYGKGGGGQGKPADPGFTAAHLSALHLPVNHEQEHAGTRCSHGTEARDSSTNPALLLRGSGLPWKQTGWRLGHTSQTRGLRLQVIWRRRSVVDGAELYAQLHLRLREPPSWLRLRTSQDPVCCLAGGRWRRSRMLGKLVP